MSEWKEVIASVFCTEVTDGTHDSPKPVSVGKYLLTSKHLQEYSLDFANAYMISQEDYEKAISRSKVDQYDVLFSMIGTIGTTHRVTDSYVDFAVKNMGIFKFGGDCLKSKWLYYWLKTRDAKEYINSCLSGTTQGYMTLKALRNFPISVPDPITMEKIASILSSLDSKIAVNKKICENLEAQAQALFKHWFVDFAPFKNGKFVESELGPIPEGWRVGRLGEIAEITMGQSPAGSSYNEKGEGVIFYQGRTEFGFRYPSVRLYTTEPKRFAEPLSTLLSVRAPVGDINVATEKCCIGRGLASIKSNMNCHSYIFYLLQSMKRRFDVYNGEGTVFGSINKDSLNGFEMVIPPSQIISAFEELVEKFDKKILESHQESSRLSTLRDTLLPKLMSGEIKVNDIEL